MPSTWAHSRTQITEILLHRFVFFLPHTFVHFKPSQIHLDEETQQKTYSQWTIIMRHSMNWISPFRLNSTLTSFRNTCFSFAYSTGCNTINQAGLTSAPWINRRKVCEWFDHWICVFFSIGSQVKQLGNKSVSWVRVRDDHILSVDRWVIAFFTMLNKPVYIRLT